MMKPFLVFLLVASCQAIELFDNSVLGYDVVKNVELKNLVKVAEDEMFKMLTKEYPNEDPKMLHELSHQVALLIKNEVDAALALVENGSKMAMKLTHNMLENLKKAASDMVDGLDSIPESVKKFIKDFTRDVTEMENAGVLDLYMDDIFDYIIDRVVMRMEYAVVERRDIWGQLNDTLHRIIGHLSGKFSDLKDFFKKSIKVGSEKLQPHLINIKRMAQDLIANISVVSQNVAQQALEFFKPFSKQLGDIWTQLVEKIHARFHNLANPDSY